MPSSVILLSVKPRENPCVLLLWVSLVPLLSLYRASGMMRVQFVVILCLSMCVCCCFCCCRCFSGVLAEPTLDCCFTLHSFNFRILLHVYSCCAVSVPQQVELVLKNLRVSKHGHWYAGWLPCSCLVSLPTSGCLAPAFLFRVSVLRVAWHI